MYEITISTFSVRDRFRETSCCILPPSGTSSHNFSSAELNLLRDRLALALWIPRRITACERFLGLCSIVFCVASGCLLGLPRGRRRTGTGNVDCFLPGVLAESFLASTSLVGTHGRGVGKVLVS